MAACESCGSRAVIDGDKFCPDCGQRVHSSAGDIDHSASRASRFAPEQTREAVVAAAAERQRLEAERVAAQQREQARLDAKRQQAERLAAEHAAAEQAKLARHAGGAAGAPSAASGAGAGPTVADDLTDERDRTIRRSEIAAMSAGAALGPAFAGQANAAQDNDGPPGSHAADTTPTLPIAPGDRTAHRGRTVLVAAAVVLLATLGAYAMFGRSSVAPVLDPSLVGTASVSPSATDSNASTIDSPTASAASATPVATKSPSPSTTRKATPKPTIAPVAVKTPVATQAPVAAYTPKPSYAPKPTAKPTVTRKPTPTPTPSHVCLVRDMKTHQCLDHSKD